MGFVAKRHTTRTVTSDLKYAPSDGLDRPASRTTIWVKEYFDIANKIASHARCCTLTSGVRHRTQLGGPNWIHLHYCKIAFVHNCFPI